MKSSLIPQSANDPDRFGRIGGRNNRWLNPVCSAFTMFKVTDQNSMPLIILVMGRR